MPAVSPFRSPTCSLERMRLIEPDLRKDPLCRTLALMAPCTSLRLSFSPDLCSLILAPLFFPPFAINSCYGQLQRRPVDGEPLTHPPKPRLGLAFFRLLSNPCLEKVCAIGSLYPLLVPSVFFFFFPPVDVLPLCLLHQSF